MQEPHWKKQAKDYYDQAIYERRNSKAIRHMRDAQACLLSEKGKLKQKLSHHLFSFGKN